MRKIIALTILILLSSVVSASAAVYHLFFVLQKQTFTVDQVDYQAWVVGPRYYMEADDPAPEGYQVYHIDKKLASAGVYDMIYIAVSNSEVFSAATLASGYAGGGRSYGAAWVDFTVRSYEQIGVHSNFPVGAGAKLVLPVRWVVGEEQLNGSLGDWLTAGAPLDSAFINVGVRILGAD